jgi:HEPN domain-containing protein
MQPITLEWIAKAEADFATAQRELVVTDRPNYDGVCFHAQQCVEKYLKAFLQESNIVFPRSHDLSDLLSLTLSIQPGWISMQPDLNTLSAFAVEYRYPGESSDKRSKRSCREVRQRSRCRTPRAGCVRSG